MKITAEFWQLLLSAELHPAKSRRILEDLGSSDFAGNPIEGLRRHPALAPEERRRLESANPGVVTAALARGISLLLPEAYSELLLQTEYPPALFVDGDAECLAQPTVGIVGTRNASTYGKACAQKFAEALGRAGVTVVSGGALGVDAAAHQGALAGGGKTVAVLAGGVDNIYPPINGALFQRIRQQGCLVSQFAVGSKPRDYKFLMRNSLIASLSEALLVIEAPTKSGSLNTANQMGDLGRDVFVVPAGIDIESYRGSFNLIRDGATLVYHPDQILEAMNIESAPLPKAAPASSTGDRIMGVLETRSQSTEKIVELTGLDTSEVLSELTMLELDGLVIRDGIGYAKKP